MTDTENTILEGEVIDNNWFLSAINGDLKYLKKHALDNVGKTGEGDCTALMYSADCNRVACVDYLIMFEEEIGKVDINGNTALMYATKKNNIDCVKILAPLESNIFNKDGKRAINFAKEFGFVECFNVLNKFETLEDEEENNNKTSTDDGKDDSNSERNLIKENKKLRKEFNVIKSANNEVDRKIGNKKDRDLM